MMDSKTIARMIIGILSLTVFVGLVFQNCSRVGFESSDELIKAGIIGELRNISLDPEQKESRPSIEVSTILDNSNSMKPIHNHVAEAFQTVTSRLRGFSGNMSLYTTTQSLTGDKSSVSMSELIRYQNGTDWIELPLSQIGSLLPSTSYWNIKRYSISQSHSAGRLPLSFWSDMTDQQFADFTDSYSTSIAGIGTSGDDKEQGLCSVLRIAEANRNSQAYQAFIIAANEDDASELNSCLKEEVQEVRKELANPTSVACQPGDQGCQYSYEMDYLPNRENHLSYSYRQVTESIKYQSTTPVETWKIEYRYNRHRRNYNYKIKQRKEWVSYRRYTLVDNLPQAESASRVYNKNGGNPINGYCEANNEAGTAVSCDEVLANIPADLRPYGLVPDSCKVFCKNEISTEKSVLAADYVGGTCSANGETEGFRPCNSTESNSTAALVGLDASHIESCRHSCVTDGNSLRSANLTERPSNCNQTCSATQREFADSKSPAYIDPEDIFECDVKCPAPTYPWRNLALNDRSIYHCSGVNPSQNGSAGEVSCMSDENLKQLAANHLGDGASVENIRDCLYTCSHSIRSKTMNVANPSTCELGKTQCSTDEWNSAVVHFLSNSGTSELFMVQGQCYDECNNLAPRSKCSGKIYDSPQMCSTDNIQGLLTSCAVSGHNLDQASCRRDQGYKIQPSTQYNARVGSWVKSGMIADNATIISETANRLTTAFANRFFVAQFVVPPGDPDCKPESQYIDPAYRYRQLGTLLGDGNSRVFPVCLSSYEESLGFVLDLVVNWVSHSYQLAIDPMTEWVWRIRLVYKNGSVQEIPKDYYKVEQGVLNLNEEVSLEGVLRLDIDVITPRRN